MGRRPSRRREAVQRNFWFCTIDDPTTLRRCATASASTTSWWRATTPTPTRSWPDTQALAGRALRRPARRRRGQAHPRERLPAVPPPRAAGRIRRPSRVDYTAASGRLCEARPRVPGHIWRTELRGHCSGALQNRQLAVTTINSTTTTESPTPRASTTRPSTSTSSSRPTTSRRPSSSPSSRPTGPDGAARSCACSSTPTSTSSRPRRLQGEERDQVVADAEHLHRQLTDALAPPHRRAAPGCARRPRRPDPGQRPIPTRRPGRRARRRRTRRRAPPALVGAGPGRRLGAAVPAVPPPTPTRSPSSSPTPRRPAAPWTGAPRRAAPRRREGRRGRGAGRRGPRLAGRRRRGRGARRRRARASAGWAGSRSGRSSSPRAARWSRCCANAGAAPVPPAAANAVVLGALDAGARRPRPPRTTSPTTCPAASPPSTRASTPAPLTRSALTGMVDAIGRDSARRIEVPAAPPNVRTAHRRHRGVPRSARRQRVRRAGARRRRARRARRRLGPLRHPRARRR